MDRGHEHRLDLPTLVLLRGSTAATPVSQARDLARRVRRADLDVLPGATHLGNVEAADQFTRALKQFLTAAPS